MKRSTLATELIRATNNAQRKKLLADNRKLADVRLARELKDYCYRIWTTNPSETRKAAAALRSLNGFAPEKEIAALASWVSGIAEITAGKLEAAAKSLDQASRALNRLGREHESAQPLVARLIALAMLGKYTAAQATGETALRIFSKYGDQLAAGKIEMNLSNIVSRRDEYRLAEKYCVSAYRRFKKLDERVWQTMAENGLANTYAELNEFARAEEFYGRALTSARRAKMNLTVAEIEASMGNLALFRGRYGEAIRMLELSRQKYEKLGMPHQTAIADLEIADIYAELNLVTEAVEIYRRIIPTLSHLKLRAEEARARSNFGRALATAGDHVRARAELKAASKLFERERNPTAAAAVQLHLAALELTRNNLDDALMITNRSSAVLDVHENIRLRLSALWLRGEILARLGRFDEAKPLLTRSLNKSRKLEQPAVAQAAMNSLGVVARATGDVRKAAAMFESAIEVAESSRSPLPGEEFQMAYLAKSLEPYENLAALHVAEGEIEKAFVATERARARSLLEAVALGSETRQDAESTKLRDELNRLYSRLSQAEEAETRKIQTQVRDREKKLSALSLRMQSSSARRKGTKLHGFAIDALQKHLGDDRMLVEFTESAGEYSAFLVTNNTIEYVAGIAKEAEVVSLLEGLHFQFGALRYGGPAVATFSKQLKSRADAYLSKLYDLLLRRLESGFENRDLVVVPSGALNYVPFHALLDGAKYIVESRDVRYAPSGAVWVSLQSKRSRAPQSSLLMAYADERIPLVNREVDVLARRLPGSKKLTGRQSTFSAFQQNARESDVIHLACHGQFRPDNPMFSSLHLADGWVTVRDVCATKLKARLVTLSACETGLNKIFAGDEILGLARGFLSAGARSLVLSLWTVNDEATTNLMAQFYSRLQLGAGVSASLRIAQRDFIDRGEHPYFWSPFVVIG